MLIEFSLSNHKSFESEQTLSLIASKLKDNHSTRVANIGGHHPLEVLTTAVLFGKNGSGKSALVDGIRFVRNFVRNSSAARQKGDLIDQTPFKLNKTASIGNTHFRIVFSVNTNVYQFMFEFNKFRVISESIFIADRSTRFRRVYERNLEKNSDTYTYGFGELLKGDKSTWVSATRDNALFISTAVQLNAEGLQEPFNWLTVFMKTIDASSGRHSNYTADQCKTENNKRLIINFLRRLDIGVDDIKIEEENFDESLFEKSFTGEFLKEIRSMSSEIKKKNISFLHRDDDNELVDFSINEESTGTRTLFGLAGPMFDALSNGYCLIIDEINTNLHPLVVHALIEAFSDPELNSKRAQLVFTSHDTSLLRDSYFRRDQVWFVDKDKSGRSALVPLTEFSPRKGEALDKGYLSGRYGGIPFIAPDLGLEFAPDGEATNEA